MIMVPRWLQIACATLVLQGQVRAEDRSLGEAEYQLRCAVCHGADAKGQGPFAAQLKVEPPDLTQLAKKNGGIFPLSAVYEKIDGRQEVKAHGTRDMPVWGYRYMPSPNPSPQRSNPTDPEPVVRNRILSLIDYLSSIQEK